MIPIPELRRWSAEDLLEWKLVMEPNWPYVTKDGVYTGQYKYGPKAWTPDLDTAPAWQIKAVIEAMQELGWSLITSSPSPRYKDTIPKTGAKFYKGVCEDDFWHAVRSCYGWLWETNPWPVILLAAHAAWKAGKGEPT